ncbi:MAG: nucleoside hydrolase [Cellvibrionales bacterium TMED122]|nr:MAG: nucleoside hydrolase [Cellvibrionales bacterium TMED122]
MSNKIRILLDTDANNEIDDQHAIAYLLLSGEPFIVEGLTVNRTNNGGDIEAQALEAERIVRLCTLHPQLTVTRGASESFNEIATHLNEPNFDGEAAVNLIIERADTASETKLVIMAIGKLTNVALALKKAPHIARHVRVVWLGSNYPDPGEYNLESDPDAVNFVLDTDVEFEIAVVRYFESSGTSAVRVTLQDLREKIAGRGPPSLPVIGRNGGAFTCFGDYSVDLLEHVRMSGTPPSRALYDMAALAVIKNPSWAKTREIAAPKLHGMEWIDRSQNPRKIVIWEHFERSAILNDFFSTIDNYELTDVAH